MRECDLHLSVCVRLFTFKFLVDFVWIFFLYKFCSKYSNIITVFLDLNKIESGSEYENIRKLVIHINKALWFQFDQKQNVKKKPYQYILV